MSEFKFNIGDTLTHVAGCGEKLFVVERTLQEFPGGIERHYFCRVISRVGLGGNLVQFNETELKEVPKPDPAKEAADKIEDVKEWAVAMADFDFAAKLRDLKQQLVDAAIQVKSTKAPAA